MNDIEEFKEAKQRLQDRIEELKKSLEEKEKNEKQETLSLDAEL